MKFPMTDGLGSNEKLMLWLALGVAVLIRLWGTWYGLPFSYWVDEYHEVMRALELGAGGFNFDRTSKGGFYFLLFFEYGLYFVLLKLMGVVKTANDFAELFVRDPSAFYLMGRVTAALMGALTVAAVYWLTRRAYTTKAALLAAIFLAINVVHVDLSRRIGVDVPMAMFATGALYFGLRIANDGLRKDYLLAALCAALATTTKLPGILVVLPLIVAHTYAIRNKSGGIREWFGNRDLWLAGALFVLVLIVTNPGIVAKTGYLSLFLDQAGVPSEEFDGLSSDVFIGNSRPNLYFYYLSVMNDSMGWPLLGLALFSVIYALWRRAPADVLLLTYAIANYVVISSTTSETLYYPRYALPVIIVLVVLAGRMIADLTNLLTRYRAALIGIVVAACVALPVGDSAVSAYALSRTDTRTLALRWIGSNVPVGSKILIEGLKIGPRRETVPLLETREAIGRRIQYWKAREPKQAKFLELQLAVHPGGGHDLELVRLESIAPLVDYLAQGVEYFVVRPDQFLGSRRTESGSARLIQDMRTVDSVRLIKRFDGYSPTQLGPTIEIYRSQYGS